MNYIYDIVLNFQNNYYQFFEWNRTDKIKNINKISVYHVSDQDILDLTNNKIIIDNTFLNKLKDDNKKNKKLMCLVSNQSQTIGLLFSNDGVLLKRSSLMFEEETEVNNYVKDLPLTKIDYIKNEKQELSNRLRIEKEKKDRLIEYIKNTSNELTLKYLYYEYFKEECTNLDKIKETLINVMESEWNNNKSTLYKTISILTKKDLLTK